MLFLDIRAYSAKVIDCVGGIVMLLACFIVKSFKIGHLLDFEVLRTSGKVRVMEGRKVKRRG